MTIKNSIFVILTSTLLSFSAFGQDRKLDKLELLYNQEHYKMVFVRSGKLMDSPDYDYTELPKLYKSLSAFRMAENPFWLKRNKGALTKAEALMVHLNQSEKGKEILSAHSSEIVALNTDITAWIENLQGQGKSELASQLADLQDHAFLNIPKGVKKETVSKPVNRPIARTSNERTKIIAFAEKSIGVPYVWGGTSPNGFDCSGYTTYVMKEFGITMPRRATDQQKSSVKIKRKDVMPGDLVFFNNGSGVSHVGIIVSNPGQPLSMIHASSSKGITVTNLETSTYWKKRLDSFGSYIN